MASTRSRTLRGEAAARTECVNRFRRRKPRAGFALVAVLTFLVFVFAMITTIVKTIAQQNEAVSNQVSAIQSESLMRSAAERVQLLRSQDPQFSRESWTPKLASGGREPTLNLAIEDGIISIVLETHRDQRSSIASRNTTHYRIEADHVIPL